MTPVDPEYVAARFTVLSLRVWLASLPADARRVRSQYAAWQAGTQWTNPSVFDKGLGGFSALKDQAAEENARVRKAGPEPVSFSDALRAVLAGPTAEGVPPRQ